MQRLTIDNANFGMVKEINSHFSYDEYILLGNEKHFEYFLEKRIDLKNKTISLIDDLEVLCFDGIITGYNEDNNTWTININRTSDIKKIRLLGK